MFTLLRIRILIQKLLTGHEGIVREGHVVLPRTWRWLPGRAKAWAEEKGEKRGFPGRGSVNHVIGVYRGWQFVLAQQTDGRRWKTGRQDLVTEGLVGRLYLRNHVTKLRSFQMGSGEARFVFWNDCSGGWTDLIRYDQKTKIRKEGYYKSVTDGRWGLGLQHTEEEKKDSRDI